MILVLAKILFPVEKNLINTSNIINRYNESKLKLSIYLAFVVLFTLYFLIVPGADFLDIFIIAIIYALIVIQILINIFTPAAVLTEDYLLYRVNIITHKVIKLKNIQNVKVQPKYLIAKCAKITFAVDEGKKEETVTISFINDIEELINNITIKNK